MAELLITEIDGIGEAEYFKVNAELGVNMETGEGDWPVGLIRHTAGITDAGLIVVELWESREAQGAELPRLGAAIQKLGLQGLPMRSKWASKLLAHPPDKAS